jgi:hypothetical protein
MGTVKDIVDRKIALLDRYRTALLDEMLEEKRAEAAIEVENDRFAWKGEFRTRDEIMALYKERSRWDRRFLVDTFLIAVLLFGVVAASSQIVSLVSPKSSWHRGQDVIRGGIPIPEYGSGTAEEPELDGSAAPEENTDTDSAE